MKTLLILLSLLSLVSCGRGPAGNDGLNGLSGQDGIQGEKGDKGDKGDAGQNAASISTIKFCPNLVDSYGQAYSERGLCINGKVYAVYSSNDLAALVELSNGTYVTTTPQGTNCTFTIDSNTCNSPN